MRRRCALSILWRPVASAPAPAPASRRLPRAKSRWRRGRGCKDRRDARVNARDGDVFGAVAAVTGTETTYAGASAKIGVAFDCAGDIKSIKGPPPLEAALRLAAPGGRIVCFGAFEGAMRAGRGESDDYDELSVRGFARFQLDYANARPASRAGKFAR